VDGCEQKPKPRTTPLLVSGPEIASPNTVKKGFDRFYHPFYLSKKADIHLAAGDSQPSTTLESTTVNILQMIFPLQN
jgi:hypothetical protein